MKTDIPRWQEINKIAIALLALLTSSASLAAMPW